MELTQEQNAAIQESQLAAIAEKREKDAEALANRAAEIRVELATQREKAAAAAAKAAKNA